MLDVARENRVAAALRLGLPDLRRFDAKILATDVSAAVLEEAAEARYPLKILDEIPKRF